MEEFKFKRPQAQQTQQVAPGATPGFTFRRPAASTSSAFPALPETPMPANNAESVLSRYEGKGLTRADILNDDDLMALVEKNLNFRYKDGTLVDPEADKRTKEEKVDTWLNYHRALTAGNSVSLASEIGYAARADEESLAALGEGYTLFDKLDNSLIGDGTWSDTADAVGDYLYYSVVDPVTVVSLGVGKVFAQAGTKGATMALRTGAKTVFDATLKQGVKSGLTQQAAQAAAEAAAKKTLQQGFGSIGTTTLRQAVSTTALKELTEANIKAGMTSQAAAQAARAVVAKTTADGTLALAKKEAARFAVGSYGVDMIASVGADVAYQQTRLITGVQEDYSIPQTAVAALGALMTPAVAAGAKAVGRGVKKVLPKVMPEFNTISSAFRGRDPVQSMDLMKSLVDLNKVNATFRGSAKNFLDNIENSTDWLKSMKRIEDAGQLKGTQTVKEFYKYLTLGYVDKSGTTVNGYTYELANAGLYYVPRGKDDNETNFIADAIAWMEPQVFETLAKGFEKSTGQKMLLSSYDPKVAADEIRQAVRVGAQSLNVSSQNARILKTKDNLSTVQKALGINAKDPDKTAYGQWVLSTWKRVVTSHPATTAANLKGWVGLSLMNSTSDLIQGTLEYGAGTFLRAAGKADAGKLLQQQGRGSLLGLARRGGAILNHDATLKEGMEFLEQMPTVRNELNKTLTGDVGMSATGTALKDFNIPENMATRGVEKYVDVAQKVTGAILQDQITKTFSFMAALDRQILRTYGQTYDDFMAQPDAWVKMASPDFQNEVLARALDRTQRETASKSWTDKKGSNFPLLVAKFFEKVSNDSRAGYLLPFGRFLNTSVATIGDFSMFNAVHHVMKRQGGANVDANQDEFAELVAKGLAGWGIVASMSISAQDKIDEGLAWNQERRMDGSIEDITYDFPESYLRIAAQVLGHRNRDQDVPEALKAELADVYIMNSFRASQEGLQAVKELVSTAVDGEASELYGLVGDSVKGFIANLTSGLTRPLDVPNQLIGVATGEQAPKDRRQGDVFALEALRYVDNIVPMRDAEQRYSPTKGGDVGADLGKTLFGSRSTGENVTVEELLNSIGMASWKAMKWEGEPMVKNRMDALSAPILNSYANNLLKKHPNFFDLRLEQRELLVTRDVIEPAKEAVRRMIRTGAGTDSSLSLLEQLGKKPQKDVKKVMDYLGQEGSISDIAKEEGGKEKLETLLYMIDNWDKIITPK